MPTGKEKLYAYNSVGLLSKLTNGRGQILTYTYDALNRMTVDAGTEYTYDKNGNLLTVTDKSGTTKRTYDRLNRLTSFTDANGNKISYAYDAIGNLLTLTYPDGKKVLFRK